MSGIQLLFVKAKLLLATLLMGVGLVSTSTQSAKLPSVNNQGNKTAATGVSSIANVAERVVVKEVPVEKVVVRDLSQVLQRIYRSIWVFQEYLGLAPHSLYQ